MKFVFFVLCLICYCNTKFNVSIILSDDDEMIKSKREMYFKVGSLFEDWLDIKYVKSSRKNTLYIYTGLEDLKTKSSTIYSRRLLHPYCEEYYIYASLIYSAVEKCIT